MLESKGKKKKQAGNKQAEENNKGNAVSEMKREISEIKSYFFDNKKKNVLTSGQKHSLKSTPYSRIIKAQAF